MGVFFSRFRRKQTTIEVLEAIDKEISSLQRNRKVNQDRQKQIVTSLLIYSIAAYIVAALIFFCVYFPDTWQLRFLYSIPLLIFPVLIWGIKKLLHWYFVKRLSSNDLALQELRERKRQILEDVMETETYKRAREILEKFDPARLRKSEGSSEAGAPMNVTGTPGTVITQRTIQTTTQQVRGATSMPTRMQTPTSIPRPDISTIRPRQPLTPYPSTPTLTHALGRPTPQSSFQSQAAAAAVRGGFSGAYAPPPGPPLPRSILPQKRGTMDRLMDYLVGDGPENRYALICQQCYSHNGMALKEEFEYLNFRCCYCYTLNPAKKQRPIAPRLEFFAPQGRKQEGVVVSNEESDDDDVDREGDDYSDQESLESDTSAGIPPIQSSSTPMGVESPASAQAQQAGQRTQLKFADAGQGRSRKPAEATSSSSSTGSSKPDQANDHGHTSPATRTPSVTRSQATKIPDTTSASPTPTVTRNQATKIPVSKGITDTSSTATSLEQKDPMHSQKMSQNAQPYTAAPDKRVPESTTHMQETLNSNTAVASDNLHADGAQQRMKPVGKASSSTKHKGDDDISQTAESYGTQSLSGSAAGSLSLDSKQS